MIYWLNPEEEQVSFFPNTYGTEAGVHTATLSIKSNMDLTESEWELAFAVSPNYMAVTFTPGELPTGEYTYTLTYDGHADTGLLIVGEYEADRTEENITIQYEQFSS